MIKKIIDAVILIIFSGIIMMMGIVLAARNSSHTGLSYDEITNGNC